MKNRIFIYFILMKQLDNHLNVFLAEKNFITAKIKADVDKGRALVGEISNMLSPVVSSSKKD
jgi:hypothetical protein